MDGIAFLAFIAFIALAFIIVRHEMRALDERRRSDNVVLDGTPLAPLPRRRITSGEDETWFDEVHAWGEDLDGTTQRRATLARIQQRETPKGGDAR